MKFEHLVEINDLANTHIPLVSRAQLWRGLMLRAESPRLFVEYLDDCVISERTEDSMLRQLRYGALIIRDQVKFIDQQQVNVIVPAQDDIPSSMMYMRIEEPAPDALFVRFSYDSGDNAQQDTENEMYDAYRRSAYKEADIDAIRLIRELAESGRLDALVS